MGSSLRGKQACQARNFIDRADLDRADRAMVGLKPFIFHHNDERADLEVRVSMAQPLADVKSSALSFRVL